MNPLATITAAFIISGCVTNIYPCSPTLPPEEGISSRPVRFIQVDADELARKCGRGALACIAFSEPWDVIWLPADASNICRAELIAHELGHHTRGNGSHAGFR